MRTAKRAIKDGLYNSALGLPVRIELPELLYPRYTAHARQAAMDDRYGPIELPKCILLKDWCIVELEFQSGRPVKMVIRGPLQAGSNKDLVMVVNPDQTIRTVWCNLKSDTHVTLKREAYKKVG